MVRRIATVAAAVALLGVAPAGADAACRVRDRPTRVVDTPPPADLLAQMEVLRRPQTDADRAFLDRFHGLGMRTILGPSVRVLGPGPDGTQFYLVPGTFSYPHLPKCCLRRLSPHRQRVIRRIERNARKRAREVGLSVFGLGPDGAGGGGGGGGGALHALLNNRTTLTQGQRDGSAIVSALVPDGVATVELVFDRLVHRTVTPASNFWSVKVPLGPTHAFPAITVWKAADGTVSSGSATPRRLA
jgi:hypothetical protein